MSIQVAAAPPAKRRICYVEDHEDTALALSSLLAYAGYEVTLARNISEAFRIARDTHFDLYLLDNLLPDGSGVDLCRRLRLLDPHAPIIFLSGAAYAADREKALQAGAQEYLTKPDGLEILEPTIARLLSEAGPRVEAPVRKCG